jgi:hypothetical protein
MPWVKNLLFVVLVGGGLLMVGANLMPPRASQPVTSYNGGTYRAPEFTAAVERVNASFRDEWKAHAVRGAGPATDLLVARRLALGLMGTVPSLEEIRQLEALPSAERLPWWLDHVLHDRRFADYFAERLARAYVGTEDGPFILFRRRRLVSWLADAVAGNRPYHELVHDLIADDGLWTDKPATNFVSVTSQADKGNQPDPVRLAGRVTRAFLGLRLDCAQCHNHPFAEWKKSDFEGLSAFFGQAHVGFKGIYDGTGEYEMEDRKTQAKKPITPRVPFAPELVDGRGTRRQRLAAWVTHPKNPYFARATVNRVWALMFGRPLVDPVDNLETDGPTPAALQILADDFTAHGHDLHRLIRVMARTEVFRLDSAADNESEAAEKAWALFPMTRLRPEQVAGSVIQAASVSTISTESHILVRLARFGQQNEFLKRYGDSGEDEFDSHTGTIPQRLLLMNGSLVHEKIKEDPLNAATRIAWMAPDDTRAVEAAYLAVLTRRPTSAEAAHFRTTLAGGTGSTRTQRVEDLFWALLNSTEFSWNH